MHPHNFIVWHLNGPIGDLELLIKSLPIQIHVAGKVKPLLVSAFFHVLNSKNFLAFDEV